MFTPNGEIDVSWRPYEESKYTTVKRDHTFTQIEL